ncbi:MAG: hypothetical protein KZQ64_12175 [gamma proteobacterium symbiont of Bathyaustriella thionipta]|nr:hypothetical protein [gamma proteobacterium symbiont of Bathyaustriella thionipta]MCU7948429.1 hypothetical protein [gamma proteobacterium symbiont of Bathyaustriella thionipta]MCU7954128.1 hypothetical protein [gamma proteobacterium symbiont of Bathyaustriella thionipta]MCU7955979.1 hypothetical protein [gamma proteobacterium symbiont of Bathyaustriella thionipta]MCU7968150.1 hypothetical protein [gamma proteobacterium symbiont of Bathyaustriella thionipta]
MATIINLKQFKKQQLKKKNKARTLCNSGFHQWEIIDKNQFDVKKGQLITTYRCKQCNKIKTTAT